MTLNFREICRLCMAKKESLAPLFREHVPDTITPLSAKIMNFVPVLKVCYASFKKKLRCYYIYIICMITDGCIF
jgi:hypothetical protein